MSVGLDGIDLAQGRENFIRFGVGEFSMSRPYSKKLARRPAVKPRRPSSVRLRVESLEDRCVPAVTVSQMGGTLTIIGGNGPNTVTIAESTTPGGYDVSGTGISGTKHFGSVTDIVVTMGTGLDTVHLEGTSAPGTVLTGNLAITAAGNITVDTPDANFNVAGAFSVIDSTGRTMIVDLSSSTTAGSASFAGGANPATVTIEGNSKINGPLSFDFSVGDGTASIKNSTVTGPVSFTGGAGADALVVITSTVGGITANFGSGGTDLMSITAASTVTGDIGASAGGKLTATIDATTVQGWVNLDNSSGNGLTATVTNSSLVGLGSFLSMMGNKGIDTVLVDHTNIGQNFGIDTGNALANVTFTDSQLSGNFFANQSPPPSSGKFSVVIIPSTGGQEYTFGGDFIDGYLSIAGSATNELSVTDGVGNDPGNGQPLKGSHIDSFFSVISGSGHDIIVCVGTQVGQNFGMSTGGSTDVIDLGAVNVAGTLFDTSTGNLSMTVDGSTVGAFTLDTTAANGPTILSMDDDTVTGATSISTGAGNDLIQIEVGAANGVGTVFGGAVTVSTGDGSDTVDLGNVGQNSSGDKVTFASTSSFDGGTGTNRLNQFHAVFIGTETTTNFIVKP
jgi:hypothetical protein